MVNSCSRESNMKLALFLILCLAFAFVVESFEEEAVLEGEQGKESFEDEAVLEGEQGKQSFEDEAVLADGRGKESFEDEAVNVFADEQGKQSFEDEAVLEGEQGNESFDDEVVLEDERGKESFKHGAVFADELGKESFEDEAVLEGEQGNDKRRLGQRCKSHADCDRWIFSPQCKTDADCDRLKCCGLFGRCWPKTGPFCPSSCQADADCLRGQCCFVGQCRPKRGLGEFCIPKTTCQLRCHDDLECRQSYYFYKCLAPLPPTPTTVVPTASG
ncbi:uncharacterized protein LOC144646287 [Oculina patagonica]